MSDYNLPDNCTGEQVDRAFGQIGGTCYYCRHMVEECCDMGQCGLLLDDVRPSDFKCMDDVLGWLDDHRVDLQADGCPSWEEYR